MLLVDGHGNAHPRRFGLACRPGVILDRPVIGCARSVLVGEYDSLAEPVGSVSWLRVGGEVVGAAVCTRGGVRPIYVSVDHRVDLDSALELVLACTPRYRLPEPIRLADRLASRRGGMSSQTAHPSGPI